MITKHEVKFIKFIQKHWLLFAFFAISFLALLARLLMINFQSLDYTIFLEPWFYEMKNNGGLSSLANFPGDYNAPYMTIMALLTYLPINPLYSIKAVSILFDFALAISCVLLVRETMKNSKNRNVVSLITYVAVLFLPSVLLNSGVWGQCDSIYATFIVLSFYFFTKKKYLPTFLLLGISFAFKFQTIFVLPFFLIMYFTQKKFSFLYFFIIPCVDFILCLPAILFGWPIQNVILTYANQSTNYDFGLTHNFPNIYNLLNGNLATMKNVGLIMILVLCATILFYCLSKKIVWDKKKMLALLIVSMLLIGFVLPGMPERYMFVAEVMAIIYCILYKRNLALLALVITVPLITYSSYLFGIEYSGVYVSIGAMLLGGYACLGLIKDIVNE